MGVSGSVNPSGGGINQTALPAAQSVLKSNASAVGSDYWGNQTKATRLKPGAYNLAATLTIDGPQQMTGDHGHGTSFGLVNSVNASLLSVDASPSSDPLRYSDISHPTIADLMLNGNGGNQTGTSHGILFAAPAWSLATRYSVAGKMRDLFINGAKHNGVRLETNRNFGFLDRVIIRYSGGDNFFSQSFDNRLVNSEFGGSQTAAGVNFASGGGNFLSHVSTYLNATYGTVIGPFVNQTNADIGGCHDSNYQGGTYLDAGSQAQMMNAIIAKRFQGNSRAADGVYSDALIKNSPTPHVLSGNMHSSNGVTRPKYLVEFDSASSFAHFSAIGYSMSSVPWATAISNYPQNLILAGNQSARLTFPTGTADALAIYMGATEKWRWDPTFNTSKQPLKIEMAAPVLRLDNTAATADNKKWRLDVSGFDVRLMAQNDAESAASYALLARRSGASIGYVSFGFQVDNVHPAFRAVVATSQVNNLAAIGNITGAAPILFAEGDDANVGLVVKVKGSGAGQLVDGSSNVRVWWNTSGLGFFGTAPTAKATVAAAATDAATTQALVNSLRTALINYGLAT